jgi:hypothetical protein
MLGDGRAHTGGERGISRTPMEAARAVGLVGRAAIQKAGKPDERCTPGDRSGGQRRGGAASTGASQCGIRGLVHLCNLRPFGGADKGRPGLDRSLPRLQGWARGVV